MIPRTISRTVYPKGRNLYVRITGYRTLTSRHRTGLSIFAGRVPRTKYRVTYTLDANGPLIVKPTGYMTPKVSQYEVYADFLRGEEVAATPGYACCFLPHEWRGKRIRRKVVVL